MPDGDDNRKQLQKLAKRRISGPKKPPLEPGDKGYKSPYRTSTFTSSGGSGSGSTVPRGFTPTSNNSASMGWSRQGKNAAEANTYKSYQKVRRSRG